MIEVKRISNNILIITSSDLSKKHQNPLMIDIVTTEYLFFFTICSYCYIIIVEIRIIRLDINKFQHNFLIA